jgi:hypothetical protein
MTYHRFVTRVTRRVPLIEQEYLRSPPVLSGVRVVRYLVFCVVFCRSLFVLFRLAIVLSVLRFTYSDYAFDIFKLFLFEYIKIVSPTYFWNISIKIVLWVGKKEGKCQCSIPLTHFYQDCIMSRQERRKMSMLDTFDTFLSMFYSVGWLVGV